MVFDITENVLRYLLYKYRLLHNVHFFPILFLWKTLNVQQSFSLNASLEKSLTACLINL